MKGVLLSILLIGWQTNPKLSPKTQAVSVCVDSTQLLPSRDFSAWVSNDVSVVMAGTLTPTYGYIKGVDTGTTYVLHYWADSMGIINVTVINCK